MSALSGNKMIVYNCDITKSLTKFPQLLKLIKNAEKISYKCCTCKKNLFTLFYYWLVLNLSYLALFLLLITSFTITAFYYTAKYRKKQQHLLF